MKVSKSLIGLILGGLICFLWIYNGDRIGKKENDEDYKRSYSGKVIRAYIPETEKFLKIVLSDSATITLDFWGLRELVQVGDSIKKDANSFKFIIYKNCNQNDSVVYVGTNFYSK